MHCLERSLDRTLRRFARIGYSFNLSLDPYPRVMRIYDSCMAIAAFANAHPAKQPDAE
jgi:glutathione S-transferase